MNLILSLEEDSCSLQVTEKINHKLMKNNIFT